MTVTLKRDFKPGEYVYVVDCWHSHDGTRAIGAKAKIMEVDNKSKSFIAVLYGIIPQTYSFNDYGRLIFDTEDEAIKTANKLPKPQTTIYQIIDKRIYKKKVEDISGQYMDGTRDLVIRLNDGKNVSIREIGYSLFFDKTDVRK